MNTLFTWLNDRTGIGPSLYSWFCAPVEKRSRWIHFWGVLVVFNFLILMVTGFMLGTTFSPSTRTAWESVYFINYVVPMGWFVRGFHHFASQSQVVLIVIFVMSIILKRLYTAPREFNWWTTLALSLLVMALAHTGYLLPWDQRAYMATEIFTNIAGNTPVIGNEVKQVIQGGTEKGHQTITRLYALHVMILPILITVLFFIHWSWLHITWKRKDPVEGLEVSPKLKFWPDLFTTNAFGCLLLVGLLSFLTWHHHGADITGPADRSNPYTAARPEWYFLFLFRFLRTPFVEQVGLEVGAIHIPGLIVMILLVMPFIGKWKVGHYFNVLFATSLLLGIIGLTTLSLLEDSKNAEHQHAVAVAKQEAKRTIQLASGPAGIPVSGALDLLRNDPYIQGQKIYASRCASCHFYNGHDGTGAKPPGEAKAPDLGNFGSREWIRSMMSDFSGVFTPLAGMNTNKPDVVKKILEGEMANWSKENHKILTEKNNEKEVNQIIEFLYAQSQREKIPSKEQTADIDAGQEIFEIGVLKENVEFSLSCMDCHTIKPVNSSKILKSSGEGLDLTGYASKQWLTSFIKNPGAKEHYGFSEGHNAMPAFETQLSEHELDMLVKFLTKDYIPPDDLTSEKHN